MLPSRAIHVRVRVHGMVQQHSTSSFPTASLLDQAAKQSGFRTLAQQCNSLNIVGNNFAEEPLTSFNMPSKSVRFAASTSLQTAKRPRDSPKIHANDKSKRVRLDKDEMDYVDDLKPESSDGVEDVPSEKELLEVKRQRQRQRAMWVDVDGRTQIDDSTSLATDGIQIEPFHMKREESDGAGYFDGDTYVWRKHDPTRRHQNSTHST